MDNDNTTTTNSKTLELGTAPVGRLLMQYALPAIAAQIAVSLYNLVDRIFIGHGVGAMAISGLAITFPFMNFSGAFGAAIGVGASTLISVNLGRRNYAAAQQIFGNSITLNVVIGVVFGILCLVFLNPMLRLFGATAQTLPYAREYMIVILAGNVITHLYLGMNSVLRAASKPKEAMVITFATVAMNTILDPIFIYGLHWGIRGAAIATVIAQTVAVVWQMSHFRDTRQILHHMRGIYRLSSRVVRDIVAIGLSPFSLHICATVVVIFVNTALVSHGGDYAVGAYGIGNSVVFLFVMVVIGFNQGMQPIAGYNFGAKDYDRMLRAFNLTVLCATIVTTVGWVVSEVATDPCVRLFTDDETLVAMAKRGLRINACVLPLVGYQMVVPNFFQSIGKAKLSIFLNLSRQLIFLIPSIAILSHFFGVDGVWASLPLSDILAIILAAVCMSIYIRRLRRHEEPTEEPHMRSYNYYAARNGATPRGMAPQAGGSVYERVRKDESRRDEQHDAHTP